MLFSTACRYTGVFVLTMLLSVTARAAQTEFVSQPHIKVRLISELDAVAPGESFYVGVEMTPDDSWHVYWQNPGDSGMPPAFTWTLPGGATAGDIQWPAPSAIPVAHLMNYGYYGATVFPVRITLPDDLSGDELTIAVNSRWLVCEEICIPGKADLSLTLPVAQQAVIAPERKRMTAFLQRVPVALELMGSQVVAENGALRLELYATAPVFGETQRLAFFPATENLVAHEQPAQVSFHNNLVRIEQPLAAGVDEMPSTISGVLVSDTDRAWRFTVNTD